MARAFAGIVPTLALALAACAGQASPSHAHVGQPAPNWTEPTSTGDKISLASLKGQPVYLNFFATWCGPCNEEAPYINQLQKTYSAQGLHVIGVDEMESAKDAQKFIRKFNLVYPSVIDNGTLQSQYEINGLPVHVFIERSGTISQIVVGEMNKSEIQTAIKAIL